MRVDDEEPPVVTVGARIPTGLVDPAVLAADAAVKPVIGPLVGRFVVDSLRTVEVDKEINKT